MREFIKTKLPGVLVVKPDIFQDHRGEFIELYNENNFNLAGVNIKFIQDDISVSTKNVLRGIHGDNVTWKLVSCLLGEVYMVAVDCNQNSKQFGQWQSFILSDRNRHQVLVPPGYGLAHLVLTDKIVFHYKQSTYYNPSIQFSYKWNDPQFNIRWPIKSPILSRRDEVGHYID